MKRLRAIILAVFVAFAAGVLIFFWRLNAVVRSTIQAESSQQLNVATTLDSARVSLFGGTLALDDFTVASPKGFAAERMLSLGGAQVAVTYGQLWAQPIRIQSISVDQPQLVLEQKDLKFNIKALVDGMPPTAESGPDEPIRLIIDRFQVAGATVVLRPGIPGVPPEITIPIPPIELRDIGNADGAQNGAAVREVVLALMAALARAAEDSGQLPEQLRPLLRGDVQAIVDSTVKGVEGEIGKAVEKIKQDPRNIEQIGKDLEKGLKDLVPGNKKD